MDNDLKFEKYSWDSTDLRLPKLWYQPFDIRNTDDFVEVKGVGTWTPSLIPQSITNEIMTKYSKQADISLCESAFAMPRKYIIKEDACILFWTNDTKTVVKRSKDEKFDKRLGFLTAYFQKHCGMSKKKANKFLDKLEVQE